MRLVVLALAVVLGACNFGTTNNGGGGGGGNYDYCSDSLGGIVWVSWTINGATADDASCAAAGISSLTMSVVDATCDAEENEIKPIPCNEGRARFDNELLGPVSISLDALSSHGDLISSGATSFNTTSTPPSSPWPIDLQ